MSCGIAEMSFSAWLIKDILFIIQVILKFINISFILILHLLIVVLVIHKIHLVIIIHKNNRIDRPGSTEENERR